MSQTLNDGLFTSNVGKQFQCELNAAGNYLYVGVADPKATTADPQWQIQKFFYDDAGHAGTATRIKFANGDDQFNKVWTARAGYSY